MDVRSGSEKEERKQEQEVQSLKSKRNIFEKLIQAKK
jgi:hypothetical protein